MMGTLRLGAVTLLVLVLVQAPWASGQSQLPVVPPEFYEGFRRIEGDRITFCIDTRSYTADFDRSVAEAIAEALLLEPSIYEIEATYGIDAEFFFEDLFIWLTDHCDAYMGYSVLPQAVPDWLTPTQPYASFRYVVAARDPSVWTLTDVPLSEPIGSQMVGVGDRALIAFLQARPAASRWRRIPYADNALLVQRLLDGSVGAILIWEPALLELTDGDPEAAGVHVIDASQLGNLYVPSGMVLRQQEAFVRDQIDTAIEALIANGTIARILEEHGLPGIPGGP